MKKTLAILTFTVKEEIEKDFNTWYDGYLKKILSQVPEFKLASRFVSGTGTKNYATIYELESKESIHAAEEHLGSPIRKDDIHEWHEWVQRGLSDITWDLFEETYSVENK